VIDNGKSSHDDRRGTAPAPDIIAITPPRLQYQGFPMASDPGKSSRKKPMVVERAEASRNWKGAYIANFNCPKCRSPLSSKDDSLLGPDTCPNCRAEFVFGEEVQGAYRLHLSAVERRQTEKRQLAEEKSRAAEIERQRIAQLDRVNEQQRIDEREDRDRKQRAEASALRANLKMIEAALGYLVAISLLGSLLLGAVGIQRLADNDASGVLLLLTSVAGLVSLLLVHGLFRCLFAIHQLLTDISAKLDETRPDENRPTS